MADPTPDKDEIFNAAAEMTDDVQRRRFLDQACGDDLDLRAEIEELLAHDGLADSLLDRTAPGIGRTIGLTIAEKPGTGIGPYKLLQQIGEGGMGIVFMAEQKQPVRRRVALKVIKPGMDTRQVIARFEAERQALAMMDHPNIARVLDAGATESRRPYFVMELVNGSPITEYCDEKQLSLRERLALFLPVCRAVQHAHQKGIIHRDLKPSNILVASYDGRPVPKVIDFGVARAANQTLTEKTLFTEFGQIVGTLDYMSPEQAERNQLDIDTRSDVYSLGIVLYELLVGETPFDRERLRSAAWDEMLRIIREEEPPKPSTRVSSVSTLPAVAANRQTAPTKLGSQFRGELDWIVMKALEKDRSRRFETANQFADDIESYLADEPIRACPPSASYRVRKFARRNKDKLLTYGLVAAACLILVGGIGWTIRDRVARQRQLAEQKAQRTSRITLEVESALDEVARLESTQDWSGARAAAKRAQALLGNEDVPESLVRRVEDQSRLLTLLRELDEARAGSIRITTQGYDHAGADRAYRQAFKNYGIDLESAVAQFRPETFGSAEAATQVAAGLLDWTSNRRSLSGQRSDDPLETRLLAIADAIDPDPRRIRLRAMIGQEQGSRGSELEQLARKAKIQDWPPPTLVTLARGLREDVSLEAAIGFLRKAQDEHPDDFWLSFTVARYLHDLRANWEEQEMYLRIAAALRPDSSAVRNYLGIMYYHLGDQEQTIACYREAAKLNPTAIAPRVNLADLLASTTVSNLRDPVRASQLGKEVVALLPDSFSAWDSLAVAAYANEDWQEYLRASDMMIKLGLRGIRAIKPDHLERARAYAELGDQANALQAYSMAAILRERHDLRDSIEDMLGIGPGDRAKHYLKAYSDPAPNDADENYWNRRAKLHNGLRNYEEALAASQKSIEIYDEASAAGERPDPIKSGNNYAYIARADALVALGRSEEALEPANRAVELSPLGSVNYMARARVLIKLGRLDEALQDYKTAALNHLDFTWAWNRLGNLCKQTGKWHVLEETYRAIPNVSRGKSSYWLTCSDCIARHGQWDLYRRFCEFIVEQDGDTSTLELAANILKCLNRIPRAVTDWTRPKRLAELLLSSGREDRFDLTSMLYLRAGDYQRSLELRQQAIDSRGKTTAWDHLTMGLAHCGMGQFEEAEAMLEAEAATETTRKKHETETLTLLEFELLTHVAKRTAPSTMSTSYALARFAVKPMAWVGMQESEMPGAIEVLRPLTRYRLERHRYWEPLAHALVHSQRHDEYRDFCRKLLDRYGETRNAKKLYALLRCLTKGPDAVDDWTETLGIAQRGFDDGLIDRIMMCETLMRAGQFERALRLQLEDLRVTGREIHNWDCLRLARCHHWLGNASEAERYLLQAEPLSHASGWRSPHFQLEQTAVANLLRSQTTEDEGKASHPEAEE